MLNISKNTLTATLKYEPFLSVTSIAKTAEDIKEGRRNSPLAKEVYQSYSNFQQRYNNQRKITLHRYNT